MLRRRLAAPAAVLAAAIPVASQARIWVVDAANGPGTDFVALTTAVASVPAGALVRVRPGDYRGVSIDKPMVIVGEPNVRIVGPTGAGYGMLEIFGIPAGGTVSIRDIEVLQPLPMIRVGIGSNSGAVLLHGIRTRARVVLSDNADVRMTDCVFQQVTVERSVAALDRCSMQGLIGFPPSDVGLQVAAGADVTLSRCQARGADAMATLPNGPAIRVDGAVTVMDDGSGLVSAGNGTAATSAIVGTGRVVYSPTVRLVSTGGAPGIAATVQPTRRPLPSLRADGAPRGGIVQVDLYGSANDAYFLLVGLLARPAPLPQDFGHLWLGVPFVVDAGVVPGNGRVTLPVPVPDSRILDGLPFAWQGLSGNPVSGFAVSNPGSYTHSF